MIEIYFFQLAVIQVAVIFKDDKSIAALTKREHDTQKLILLQLH